MTSYRLTHHDPTAHRHAVEIEATVRVSGGEPRGKACQIRSLSLGGALLELGRLPLGTLVNISFGLPGVAERLSLDAVVYWCTNDRVDVLFDSLRAWEVWVLWRYLESLAADSELDDDDDDDLDDDIELDEDDLDDDIELDDDDGDDDDADREPTQQMRVVELSTLEP